MNHLGGKQIIFVPGASTDEPMACSTNKQLLTVANWMLKNARLVLTGSPSAMTQRPEFDSDGIWVCPPKVEMYQWLHHAAPNGHLGEFASDLRKVSFALADFGKVVLDKLAMSDDICKEIPDDALFTFALHYQGNGGHFVQWMGNAPNVSWVMTYTQADGEDVRLTWHPSSQGAMSIPVRASGRTFLDPKKVGISAAKASVFGGTGWQGNSSTTNLRTSTATVQQAYCSARRTTLLATAGEHPVLTFLAPAGQHNDFVLLSRGLMILKVILVLAGQVISPSTRATKLSTPRARTSRATSRPTRRPTSRATRGAAIGAARGAARGATSGTTSGATSRATSGATTGAARARTSPATSRSISSAELILPKP